MIKRDELSRYLAGLYQYQNFDDYCENGLQVEGKETIEKIVFGVSFNQPFLERALSEKPDAIIVHHGIFQKGNFKLRGPLKRKVQMLLEHGISLFGIHLPMDAHPELGHNALLLKAIGAENLEPYEVGFIGDNAKAYGLDRILEIFHQQLHPEGFGGVDSTDADDAFSMYVINGFQVLKNRGETPRKLAIVTGGSSGFYEAAIEAGVDTFFGGDIKEKIPAMSLETGTNFVNLGHYFSEKPGVLALQKHIEENFKVKTTYIEVPNPV